jgi:Zn-dependent membrane protease YugP
MDMYFDPYALLFMIPGLLLGLYAQFKLSAAYNQYLNVRTQSGASGAEAARDILDHAGLTDVPVEEVGGRLTDHYDPAKKALFLSQENFHGRSISSVGVAAHEAGHALQHQAAYAPLEFRMKLVPITHFASVAWMGILVLGMILGGHFFSQFIWVAVGIFAVITLFQIITLPVEFDASRRAKEQLLRIGLVSPMESPAVSKVLNAAALTYVAAMVGAIMQLLRLLLIARNRD